MKGSDGLSVTSHCFYAGIMIIDYVYLCIGVVFMFIVYRSSVYVYLCCIGVVLGVDSRLGYWDLVGGGEIRNMVIIILTTSYRSS